MGLGGKEKLTIKSVHCPVRTAAHCAIAGRCVRAPGNHRQKNRTVVERSTRRSENDLTSGYSKYSAIAARGGDITLSISFMLSRDSLCKISTAATSFFQRDR